MAFAPDKQICFIFCLVVSRKKGWEKEMERLTERDEDGYIHKIGECSLVDCYNKLGGLENIEDELGISLEVLFKALKDGFYFKEENWKLLNHSAGADDMKLWKTPSGDYQITWNFTRYVYLKDYGVTWALTREELENAED